MKSSTHRFFYSDETHCACVVLDFMSDEESIPGGYCEICGFWSSDSGKPPSKGLKCWWASLTRYIPRNCTICGYKNQLKNELDVIMPELFMGTGRRFPKRIPPALQIPKTHEWHIWLKTKLSQYGDYIET